MLSNLAFFWCPISLLFSNTCLEKWWCWIISTLLWEKGENKDTNKYQISALKSFMSRKLDIFLLPIKNRVGWWETKTKPPSCHSPFFWGSASFPHAWLLGVPCSQRGRKMAGCCQSLTVPSLPLLLPHAFPYTHGGVPPAGHSPTG